jgi:hypothetical protein
MKASARCEKSKRPTATAAGAAKRIAARAVPRDVGGKTGRVRGNSIESLWQEIMALPDRVGWQRAKHSHRWPTAVWNARLMRMVETSLVSRPKATVLALVVSMGLSIAGCDTRAKATAAPSVASEMPAAAPAENAPGAKVKLGAPIVQADSVPLSTIAGQPAKYAKSTVKTEGQVVAVCQAMGCWMEISDKNTDAHIRMSGHGFFIPKTAAGRRAVVEGTVLPRPDQGECEQEAVQATGKTVKLELDATGVELL